MLQTFSRLHQMNKLAVFVEGRTEQVFIERLFKEIAGTNGLRIECYAASGGGSSGDRKLTQLHVSCGTGDPKYYIMIVDCGTDNRVKSDIADGYDGLISAGYSVIIGIRDVFPDFAFSEISRLRNGLGYKMKTKPIHVLFVLGIMEVESWFLAEHTHFARLDARLTPDNIKTTLGFDACVDCLELRNNPAADLNAAYRIAGYAYRKKGAQIERTVDLLDYAQIYLDTKSRFNDLTALITSFEDFLLLS